MQDKTLSARPASTYSTNWGDDIKIAVPDTGATLGDLRHLLRSWFGNETRISGEVVQEDGGWTVTARVSGHPAIVAKGPALEPLVTKAAEGIFSQTQPYRYIMYLDYRGPLGRGDGGGARAGHERARKGTRVGPGRARQLHGPARLWRCRKPRCPPRGGAGGTGFSDAGEQLRKRLRNLGRWEQALPVFRRARKAGRERRSHFRRVSWTISSPSAMLTPTNSLALTPTPRRNSRPRPAKERQSTARNMRAPPRPIAIFNMIFGPAMPTCGGTDKCSATAITGTSRLPPSFRPTQAPFGPPFLPSRACSGRKRWVTVPRLQMPFVHNVPGLIHFVSLLPPKVARDQARTVWPTIAVSMAKAGFAREAAQLLAPLPSDCYPCLVARGEVAAQMGDRAAASRWFAQAKRIGPSFPFADEALGLMLLASRDIPVPSALSRTQSGSNRALPMRMPVSAMPMQRLAIGRARQARTPMPRAMRRNGASCTSNGRPPYGTADAKAKREQSSTPLRQWL